MTTMMDLVFMPYKQFAQTALDEYEKNSLKHHIDLGNHNFQIPDVEIEFDNPFISDHDRKVHDNVDSISEAGDPAAIASLLGQHKFFPGSAFKEQIDEYFGFTYSFVALNCLMPDQMTCVHVDRTRSLFVNNNMPEEVQNKCMPEDYQRILVFIDDQRPGEFFHCGEKYVEWKAGDIIRMPWYMPHATANCGTEPRYLISIAGVNIC